MLALKNRAEPHRSLVEAQSASLAEETAALFLAIARRSPNREHAHAIGRLSDRLHAVRLVEPEILEDVAQELAGLRDALARDDRAALRRCCSAYHRRRRRAAAAVVRRLHRQA